MDTGLLTCIPLKQEGKQFLTQCFCKQGANYYLLTKLDFLHGLMKIIWIGFHKNVYSPLFLWEKNRKKQHSLVAKIKDFHYITPSRYKNILLTYH